MADGAAGERAVVTLKNDAACLASCVKRMTIRVECDNSFFCTSLQLEKDGLCTCLVDDHTVCQFCWKKGSVGDDDLFVVDFRSHSLLYWFSLEDGVVKQVHHWKTLQTTVDLTNDGDRWEGDVDETTLLPCGWGTYYSSDNSCKYRGFRVRDRNVAYGSHYFDAIDMIEYVGMLADDKAHGLGKLYGRDGVLLYDGVFMNGSTDFRDSSCWKESSIPSHVEELTLSDSTLIPFVHLDLFSQLRHATVSGEGLFFSTGCTVSSLSELLTLVVTPARFDMLHEEERFEEESRAAEKKYTLAITNCPQLASVKCGQYAFELYSVLSVRSACFC